jgi:hypothetical protein
LCHKMCFLFVGLEKQLGFLKRSRVVSGEFIKGDYYGSEPGGLKGPLISEVGGLDADKIFPLSLDRR